MVVELDAVGAVLAHHLQHQLGDQLLHLRPEGVEPHHFTGGADRVEAAIAFLGEPAAVAPGQLRIGRCHEAEFKPGQHHQPAAAAGGDQLADHVLPLQTPVGEILELAALAHLAGVVGHTAVPHHGVEPVEAQIHPLVQRGLHAGAIAQHRHVVGGKPDAP